LRDNQGNARGAAFLTGGGCPPIPDVHEKSHPHCENLVADFLRLAADDKVDRIVIAAQWLHLFSSQCGLWQNAPCFTFGDNRDPIEQETGARKATDAFREMIVHLIGLRKQVYVVLNIPVGFELDPAHVVIKRSLWGGVRINARSFVSRSEIENYRPYAHFVAAVRDTNAQIIEPMDYLCQGDRCPALSDVGEAMYKDDGHLRPTYVKTKVMFLDDTVADHVSAPARANRQSIRGSCDHRQSRAASCHRRTWRAR